MIKINLLPIESFRQTASGQLAVTIYAIALLVVGFGLYFFNELIMTPTLAELQSTKSAQNSKLTQMKHDAAEALKQTEKFVLELAQVSAVSELEERRRDQTRLFKDLSSQVPNQSAWLVSLSHQNGILTIRGMATDHEVVAQFLSRLELMSVLEGVVLERAANDTVINGIKLVTFVINANTVFPAASLMSSGLPEVNLPSQDDISKIVSVAAPNLSKFLERNKNATKL